MERWLPKDFGVVPSAALRVGHGHGRVGFEKIFSARPKQGRRIYIIWTVASHTLRSGGGARLRLMFLLRITPSISQGETSSSYPNLN